MSENALKSIDRLIARVDEDRWLSSRYAAPAQRAQLIALYGFNYELARVRLAVSEPTLGAIRFQWWREALEALSAQQSARRHTVTEALAATRVPDLVGPGTLLTLLDRHQDAFEAGDRTLEPEQALTAAACRIVAGRKGDAWSDVAGLAKTIEAYARARRGAQGDAPAGAVLKIRPALRPALAHLALRGPYQAGRSPSPLSKRWRVLLAVLTGRV